MKNDIVKKAVTNNFDFVDNGAKNYYQASKKETQKKIARVLQKSFKEMKKSKNTKNKNMSDMERK